MGNSFGDMATASASDIAGVTRTLALNITYIAIAAGGAAFFAWFFFGFGSQRVGNKIKQAFFDAVVSFHYTSDNIDETRNRIF
jgi:hypothetical protein